MKTIKVLPKTHKRLVDLQIQLQVKLKRRINMDEAIKSLFELASTEICELCQEKIAPDQYVVKCPKYSGVHDECCLKCVEENKGKCPVGVLGITPPSAKAIARSS
ncbi:MAG: hypothetical protein ACE5OT_02870 [Candidatus Hadarchaeaceae archaeon]